MIDKVEGAMDMMSLVIPKGWGPCGCRNIKYFSSLHYWKSLQYRDPPCPLAWCYTLDTQWRIWMGRRTQWSFLFNDFSTNMFILHCLGLVPWLEAALLQGLPRAEDCVFSSGQLPSSSTHEARPHLKYWQVQRQSLRNMNPHLKFWVNNQPRKYGIGESTNVCIDHFQNNKWYCLNH